MAGFYILVMLGFGFLGAAAYGCYRWAQARAANTEMVKANSRPAVFVSGAVFGAFLLTASVPGAFFGDPHWLTNKVYFVVETLLGLFT